MRSREKGFWIFFAAVLVIWIFMGGPLDDWAHPKEPTVYLFPWGHR